MKFDGISKKIFNGFFHVTLALMLIDWAVRLPVSFHGIGIYEITFALLGCAALIRLYFEKGQVFRNMWQVLRSSKWSALALAGYLVMGVATLFYAQTPVYALKRYVVVVQMLFFGACFFYYTASHKNGSVAAIRTFCINIGISAGIIAIWSIVKYFFFSEDVYFAYISPIRDYNQYSTILIIGLISICFFVVTSSMRTWAKYAVMLLICSVLIPMIVVSGSRRSFLLVFPVAGCLLLFAVIHEVVLFVKKRNTNRQLLASIGCILLCVVCVYFSTVGLSGAVADLAGKPSEDISGPSDSIPLPDEKPDLINPGASAQDRLNENQGIGRRTLIWNAAISELKRFDIGALLIGGGASHNSDIYDNRENPLVQQLQVSYGFSDENRPAKNWMNPHNMFLQDALDGGIILLLLQVSLVLCCAGYTVKLLCKNFTHGCVLGLMFCTLFVTLFLSSASGMIANKFFWLIVMLQMVEMFSLSEKNA